MTRLSLDFVAQASGLWDRFHRPLACATSKNANSQHGVHITDAPNLLRKQSGPGLPPTRTVSDATRARNGQNTSPKPLKMTSGSSPITSSGRLNDSFTSTRIVLPSSRVTVRFGNR
ncbi:hypothetical protein VT84_01635 [Gemmata sp. SH-PL17]|nr:hypothetical protein VT84_01635 [Gemmata sp. SH-PL17]